jgi:hypothetical protein
VKLQLLSTRVVASPEARAITEVEPSTGAKRLRAEVLEVYECMPFVRLFSKVGIGSCPDTGAWAGSSR